MAFYRCGSGGGTSESGSFTYSAGVLQAVNLGFKPKMLTVAVTPSSSTAYSTWVYDEDKSTTQFWLGSSNSYAAYSTGGGSGAGYIALNTYYSNAILLNITNTGFEFKYSGNANVHYAAIG